MVHEVAAKHEFFSAVAEVNGEMRGGVAGGGFEPKRAGDAEIRIDQIGLPGIENREHAIGDVVAGAR